jgi:hypothetical protein
MCWIHPKPAPPATPPDASAWLQRPYDSCGFSIGIRSWWSGYRPGIAVSVAEYDGGFTRKATGPGRRISRTMINSPGPCP